ncbi:type II secretion system F family protein [Comamonas sp. CAH-2]|uniref:type II secretion system F family protein n=1 Tax=Comamonas sp. CAH-2 TaxID=2605745 RepID=UPI0012ADF37A|nr:type II secretion system F family protein [Comamonas sp. CAH-2]MRT20268.1 type II secretion system F family protein [Comamonas sp. CAH-2]
MLSFFGSHSILVIVGLVFVSVLLLLEALHLVWKQYKSPEAKQLERRLRALSAADDRSTSTKLVKERVLSGMPTVQRALQSMPRAHQLDRFIVQAGLEWTVSGVLLSCASLFMLGVFGATLLRQSMGLAAIVGVVLGALPWLYLQYRRRQRLGLMERQLPEALDLISRALRAGHAFSAGLQMAGEELAEPIAGEFRMVHDEINYGTSLQQALLNLGERVPVTDLRYFIVAVLIQRESGGNLTEMLTNLSRLIRERLKLHAKVRVLSAEGRLSAWILGLMPFAVAALLNLLNPEFMSALWTDPMGTSILQWLAFLMVIGVLMLYRIVRIRV